MKTRTLLLVGSLLSLPLQAASPEATDPKPPAPAPSPSASSDSSSQPTSTQQQPSPSSDLPTTHREVADMLVSLLQQTASCLETCKDAASVQAALPRLHELSNEAHRIQNLQNSLPEPTTQDYISAHEQVAPFQTAWKAIRDHIERLQRAHLISQELSDVLGLGPDTPSSSAP